MHGMHGMRRMWLSDTSRPSQFGRHGFYHLPSHWHRLGPLARHQELDAPRWYSMEQYGVVYHQIIIYSTLPNIFEKAALSKRNERDGRHPGSGITITIMATSSCTPGTKKLQRDETPELGDLNVDSVNVYPLAVHSARPSDFHPACGNRSDIRVPDRDRNAFCLRRKRCRVSRKTIAAP